MAWTTSITVTNLGERRVRVEATRTEGEDVCVYSVDAQIDLANLPQSRNQIIDALWAQHEEALAREVSIAALLDGWEDSLNTALDGMEGG